MDKINTYVIVPHGTCRNPQLLDSLNSHPSFSVFTIEAVMTPTYEAVERHNLIVKSGIFKSISGRNLSPGEIGCAASHNLARKYLAQSNEPGIILEDDAVIEDLDQLYQIILNFNQRIKNPLSVLSLIDFLSAGQETQTYSNDKRSVEFLRLRGIPPLAVASYLKPNAALSLLQNNTPITWVSDWPDSQATFFVSNHSVIFHGSNSSSSLIDPKNSLGRLQDSNYLTKLTIVSKAIFKAVVNFSLIQFIKRFLVYRLLFRVDRFRIKHNENFMDN